MSSFIHPDDYWTLWAVMLAGTGLSIWMEQTWRWAAKLSGPVLALLMAMTLSNLHLMPSVSPAYDFVGQYLVPLAIPLLLFRADARRIVKETRWMFVAFHLSAVGTILGALLATFLLHGRVPNVEHAAGIMTGSYTGGAINFFAVKESYHVSELVTNPLLVADNFIMAGMFVVLLTLAGSAWFRRHYPHPHTREADTAGAQNLAAEHWQRKGISLLDIAKSLGIALVVVAAAQGIGRAVEHGFTLGPDAGLALQMVRVLVTNPFVLITALSLAAATLFQRPFAAINGPEELGSYLLYLFLFVIGLPADLLAVLRNVPMFFGFCAIMAVTNLAVTLVGGKLLRLNLEELLLCVNATLGGPPSAAAMAIAAGWRRLVLPALLVGIWGYVIGTTLGVIVTEWLLRIPLGGAGSP